MTFDETMTASYSQGMLVTRDIWSGLPGLIASDQAIIDWQVAQCVSAMPLMLSVNNMIDRVLCYHHDS